MVHKFYSICLLLIVTVAACSQALPDAVDPSTLCYPPDDLAHGTVQPLREYYHIGHAIDFECEEGYILEGETWTVCVYNTTTRMAHWHFEIPRCRRISATCPDIYAPNYGSLHVEGKTTGSAANYSCNNRFKLVGVSTRLCQDNGEWSGSEPVCKPFRCPHLVPLKNGSVHQRNYIPGAKANYSCDDGFRLVGVTSRVCMEDCEWSATAPTCILIVLQCPYLEDPRNGSVRLSGNNPGSTATYTCRDFFVLVGAASRICQDNGEWSGKTPECLPCRCPSLENPLYGTVSQNGHIPGSKVDYQCSAGFFVVGIAYRICLDNCQWSGEAPTCMPIKCPNPEKPSNGGITLFGKTFGSKAEYHCNTGFILVGVSLRKCQLNGTWSGSEPQCFPCTCTQLENPENGMVYANGTTLGSRAHYTCNDGFKLVGLGGRDCSHTCLWTGHAPKCTPIKCPVLEHPSNGSVYVSGSTPGSTAEYECSSGFTLVGQTLRYCQLDGTWTGQTPNCSLCSCPPLTNPNYGRVSTSTNGLTVGSTASYSCSAAYKLLGNAKRTCSRDCTWTASAPKCIPIVCPHLENPTNGIVTTTGYTPTSQATYECNSGFQLAGTVLRVCQEDGRWTGERPECLPKTCSCPSLDAPHNGGLYVYGYSPGSLAKYSCNTEYRLDGTVYRVCQETCEWAGKAPTCLSPTCPSLENPSQGRVILTGTKTGSTAIYLCNEGYKLVGVVRRTCQPNGLWSGVETICSSCSCPALIAPTNGGISIGGTTPGSAVSYRCDYGFKLVGLTSIKCQDNCHWTGYPPICTPVSCPNLDAPLNGSIQLTGTTPDSRAQYECSSNFILEGVPFRLCQINGMWSDQTPKCLPCSCPHLKGPDHGSVYVNSNTLGSTAHYSCNNGYKLIGVSWRTCSDGCQWSENTPKCASIHCPILDNPTHGSTYLNGTTPGSITNYSCNVGYTLVGETSRRCLSNGQWTGKLPQCLPCSCPDLQVPRYGTVYTTGSKTGSRAEYSCSDGYRLEGVAYRICQHDCQWTGKAPTCTPPPCADVEDPRYGSVIQTGTVSGSTAYYLCDDGYKVYGPQWRTCQPNGQWSGIETTCIPITCPVLEAPVYGSVHVNGFTYGSTAQYECHEGFKLVGTRQRKCQVNEMWSEEEPVCIRITCPVINNPRNGIVYVNGNTPGSTANFSCNAGFTLEGEAILNCNNDGEWNHNVPICISIQCPNLDPLTYGSVSVSAKTPGTRAVYSCNNGFKLVGQKTTVCLNNGQWSEKPPTCVAVRCPDLEAPRYGSVFISGYNLGSIADYSCDNGFITVEEARRTCQDNGQWSGTVPTCIPVVCPSLDRPRNGNVSVNGNTPGSTTHYYCTTGFVLVGVAKRKCQDNGQWSDKEPSCQDVRCSILVNPTNGLVHVKGNTPGSTADYRCSSGFTLTGIAWRTCQENGLWTGSTPTCKAVSCPNPAQPYYGSLHYYNYHGNTAKYGSVVIYTCHPGFRMVGMSVRICQVNGQWNGRAPTCQRIQCPSLSQPKDGIVYTSGYTPGSTADYSCISDFKLVGASRRICQTNGQWSDSSPTCQATRCPYINPPRYGSIYVSGYTPGSTAQYQCLEGYKLTGDVQRTCQHNAQWSGSTPSCTIIRCPVLSSPHNGVVRVSGTTLGSNANYSCNTGFKLVGVTLRHCRDNEEWSGEPPTCQPIRCPSPSHPLSGSVYINGNSLGSMAQYRCSGGYRLIGVATRQCQENGSWSREVPVCQFITCPRPSEPSNGRVVVSGLSMGSAADYHCNSGYNIVGDAWRKCQNNGQWSGKAPVCQVVDCGQLRRPDFGYVNYNSTAFGSRAYYSCQTGYFLTGGSSDRICQANGYWSGVMPYCNKQVASHYKHPY